MILSKNLSNNIYGDTIHNALKTSCRTFLSNPRTSTKSNDTKGRCLNNMIRPQCNIMIGF